MVCEFAEFDPSAREFLGRRDHSMADPLLKGVGCDVPAEEAESNHAENAEPEKQFPQDAPTFGRWRLGR